MSSFINFATLNNGLEIPLHGLGCWQASANEVEHAVEVALDCGYRHIDTAYAYLNEEEVGRGIRKWLNKNKENKREDLFITSKLPGCGLHKGGIQKYLKSSLMKLNLSYLDLYLIHSPVGLKEVKEGEQFIFKLGDKPLLLDYGTDLIASWKEMELMVDEGLTKSIGVSNFSIGQLRKILAVSRIPPAVNQVEMHLNFQQKEMVKFCIDNRIVITAYGPLGSPGRSPQKFPGIVIPELLTNPLVKLVANNHNVTTAQVLIRFLIQQGIVTIPKSINPDRIKINADVFNFTLSETEMEALALMDKGEVGRSFTMEWMGEHPEKPW